MFIEHFVCDRRDGKEKMNKTTYSNCPFGDMLVNRIVKQFSRDCNRGLDKIHRQHGEVRCIFSQFPSKSHWSRGIVASNVHISRSMTCYREFILKKQRQKLAMALPLNVPLSRKQSWKKKFIVNSSRAVPWEC